MSIMPPSPQPSGTQFFVTRRPYAYFGFDAAYEEVVAGPYETDALARQMVSHVRGQLERSGMIGAVGVLAVRPSLWARWQREGRTIAPRFPRFGDGEGRLVVDEKPTRFTPSEITAMAVERHESIDSPPAPGFEFRRADGTLVDAASMYREQA